MLNKRLKRLIIRSVFQILSVVWKVYAALILLFTYLLFYPLYFIFLSNESTFKFGFRVIQLHSWIILTLIGVRTRVKFESELPNGPFIICPNHTSYLDILLLYRVFKKYFIFIGKRELETDKLFGIFFKKMNILVARDSAMDGMRALNQASLELKKGSSVVIFPEGTIPDNAPELMEFKNGPFKLAIKEKVPVVPVTFVNVFKLLQIGAFFKRRGKPGIARIIVNEVIPTTEYSKNDFITLRDKVHSVIDKTIKKHYANRRKDS